MKRFFSFFAAILFAGVWMVQAATYTVAGSSETAFGKKLILPYRRVQSSSKCAKITLGRTAGRVKTISWLFRRLVSIPSPSPSMPTLKK